MFEGTGPAVIGTCALEPGGGMVPSGMDVGGMDPIEPGGGPAVMLVVIGGAIDIGGRALVGGMLPIVMLPGGIMPGPMLGGGPGGRDMGDMLCGGAMV
mmetsp:Transcript_12883/g.29073  ORF Transcript_12883/g.29073 Transcript_12883/m.29073 type:complete len:98 (+) Transcript_12883:149-442(+)